MFRHKNILAEKENISAQPIKMIDYKSEEEIELIRQSSLLVGKTIAAAAAMLKPGITTASIDEAADQFIRIAKQIAIGFGASPEGKEIWIGIKCVGTELTNKPGTVAIGQSDTGPDRAWHFAVGLDRFHDPGYIGKFGRP